MPITYTVFFSGTDQHRRQNNTLLNVLKNLVASSNSQKTFFFSGCGITHGFKGTIFGTGLDEQCQEVIAAVLAQIQKGNEVKLNVYGLSRGAVAALMLAKELGEIDPKLLEVNLALLDPVPGNSITAASMDPFEIGLANKTMDLSHSKNLKRVLALYPHFPLPAIMFHAPMIAQYPERTEKEQDAIAGCHADAQKLNISTWGIGFSRASFISFARIYSFLKKCGTQFKPLPTLYLEDTELQIEIDSNNLDEALLKVYEVENRLLPKDGFDREAHSLKGKFIKTKEQANYFNLHHQHLKNVDTNPNNARVTIESDQGFFAKLNRLTQKYPKTWGTLKWAALGLCLASLIIFTGGFGLIPVATSLLTDSVLFVSLLILTPIASLAMAGLWYGIVKPALLWVSNKIYYPHFEIRELPDPPPPVGHAGRILHRLGGPASSSSKPVHSEEEDDSDSAEVSYENSLDLTDNHSGSSKYFSL